MNKHEPESVPWLGAIMLTIYWATMLMLSLLFWYLVAWSVYSVLV